MCSYLLTHWLIGGFAPFQARRLFEGLPLECYVHFPPLLNVKRNPHKQRANSWIPRQQTYAADFSPEHFSVSAERVPLWGCRCCCLHTFLLLSQGRQFRYIWKTKLWLNFTSLKSFSPMGCPVLWFSPRNNLEQHQGLRFLMKTDWNCTSPSRNTGGDGIWRVGDRMTCVNDDGGIT